jgi:hypothetical protein
MTWQASSAKISSNRLLDHVDVAWHPMTWRAMSAWPDRMAHARSGTPRKSMPVTIAGDGCGAGGGTPTAALYLVAVALFAPPLCFGFASRRMFCCCCCCCDCGCCCWSPPRAACTHIPTPRRPTPTPPLSTRTAAARNTGRRGPTNVTRRWELNEAGTAPSAPAAESEHLLIRATALGRAEHLAGPRR